MPRCIAPGCTSGYDSNPEKVHFFGVPNNSDTISRWQTAIRRKDFVVKPRQVVCENHFAKGDILWFKEFLNPEGIVIARGRYQRPQLRKGAVPTVFPWTEAPTMSETSAVAKVARSGCNPSSHFSPVEDTGKDHVPFRRVREDDQASSLPPSEGTSKDSFSLDQLLADDGLCLPSSWTQNTVTYGEICVPCFTLSTCIKVDEIYVPVVLKQLFLQPNMEAHVQVLGRRIDATTLGVQKVIKSTEALQNTLSSLNSLNVCCGCKLPDDLRQMKCDILYEDLRGSFRHVGCTMLSRSIQCSYCAGVKKTLLKKKSRSENREAKKSQSLRPTNLSLEQRDKVTKLRKIFQTRRARNE